MNCLLCKYCIDSSESINGYLIYKDFYCSKFEEKNEDTRFPYKNTKCNKFENDYDFISLHLKLESNYELWKCVDENKINF